MSIYRTGNSPFWHVRIYDNLRKRYIVRSSKEKARLTAKEVAEELFDEHRSKKNQAVAVSRDTSFRHYAEKLQAHEKAMAARMRGKRFFTDTRAILAPTVRKGSKEKRIGMLEYFGDYDVSKITAGMVREYFQKVDEKRDTPLAASTKAKHGMVMRKVLTLAYEDGLIDTLPPMPKNRVKDNPRTSFSEAEYKHLLTVTRECIERGDIVRNTPVPWDMYYLIVMLVHTFMRPTESEIFAIRHCDVTVKDNPRCLHIMANGKTGMREVTTMPDAVDFYETLKELNPEWRATDRLLFPVYGSVVTAASMARRFFTHILAVAKLQTDSFGRPRSLYSPTLRRYHQHLWSKPLPCGERFELLQSSGGGYLYHRSSLGEFHLASDGIIHSYLPTKRMAEVINQVPSETSTALENLGFTIGGFIIFPGNRVDKKMTINGARGCHRKIEDRFDLTLECIRRHYENTESPLSETLKRYSDFFDLFRDFKGYTEFFFLQDLVTEGGDGVRFFLPFDNFQRQAFPIDADEYRTYAKCATDFLNARSARMISSNKGAVR